MKTTISLCLALLGVSPVYAQMLRPHAVHRASSERTRVHVSPSRGDHHRHRPSVHAGFSHGQRDWGHDYGHRDYGHSPFHHRRHGSHVGIGFHGSRFGYGFPTFGYYSGYGYGYPYYRDYPYYSDYPYNRDHPYYGDYGYYGSGRAATSGLLLGALAGGIIGHNSGDLRHSAWRGSAWGAGLGWLLGSVVDANRRAVAYRPAPGVVQPAPAVQVPVQTAPVAQPQQVTIINNYYNAATPMSAANGMFGR